MKFSFCAHSRASDAVAERLREENNQNHRISRRRGEIFDSAPVGLLTIEPDGTIGPGASTYCNSLLEQSDVAGRSAFDLIFASAENHLDPEHFQAIEQLFAAFDSVPEAFSDIRSRLPAEIPFCGLQTGPVRKWLHVSYHPLVSEGRIQRILLVIEDRSNPSQIRQGELGESILRILEVKRCRPDLLKLLMRDFASIFDDLQQTADRGKWDLVKNLLHGIKGNARIVNFSHLAQLAHDFETFLNEPTPADPTWRAEAAEQTKLVQKEWAELQQLIFALQKEVSEPSGKPGQRSTFSHAEIENILRRYRETRVENEAERIERARLELALRVFNSTSLSELETKIRAHVDRVAETYGKEAVLLCNWNDLRVNEEIWSALSESLLHLINNAIAHGIETPEVRKSLNKNRRGTIGIDCVQIGNQLRCRVWDDGRGIDLERVRTMAVQKKVISLVESLNGVPEDLMQLIFSSGFSTAKTIDQTAGRGVGLAAVTRHLRELNGDIMVEAGKPNGTSFSLTLPLERGSIEKRLMALSDWFRQLENELIRLGRKLGIPVPSFQKPDLATADYILYCVPDTLVLAVSTILGRYSSEKVVDIKVSVRGDRFMLDLHFVKTHSGNRLPPEFTICLPECFTICFMHQGVVAQRDRETQIALGQIVGSDQFPTLRIESQPGLPEAAARETLRRIEGVAGAFNVKLTNDLSVGAPVLTLHGGGALGGFTCGATTDVLRAEMVRAIEHLLR